MQESDTDKMTCIYACNGFNELKYLVILLTVWHHWPAVSRLTFNYYKHWVQFLIICMGIPPAILLIREGVTQKYSLLIFLYETMLSTLAENIQDVDLVRLAPFYSEDTAFYGLDWWSAHLTRILLEQGPTQG